MQKMLLKSKENMKSFAVDSHPDIDGLIKHLWVGEDNFPDPIMDESQKTNRYECGNSPPPLFFSSQTNPGHSANPSRKTPSCNVAINDVLVEQRSAPTKKGLTQSHTSSTVSSAMLLKLIEDFNIESLEHSNPLRQIYHGFNSIFRGNEVFTDGIHFGRETGLRSRYWTNQQKKSEYDKYSELQIIVDDINNITQDHCQSNNITLPELVDEIRTIPSSLRDFYGNDIPINQDVGISIPDVDNGSGYSRFQIIRNFIFGISDKIDAFSKYHSAAHGKSNPILRHIFITKQLRLVQEMQIVFENNGYLNKLMNGQITTKLGKPAEGIAVDEFHKTKEAFNTIIKKYKAKRIKCLFGF